MTWFIFMLDYVSLHLIGNVSIEFRNRLKIITIFTTSTRSCDFVEATWKFLGVNYNTEQAYLNGTIAQKYIIKVS